MKTGVKVFNEDLPYKRSKTKTLIRSLLKFIKKLRFKTKTLIRSKTKTQLNKQPSVQDATKLQTQARI